MVGVGGHIGHAVDDDARQGTRIVDKLQVVAGKGSLGLVDVKPTEFQALVVDDARDPVLVVRDVVARVGVVLGTGVFDDAVTVDDGLDFRCDVACLELGGDILARIGELAHVGEDATIGVDHNGGQP